MNWWLLTYFKGQQLEALGIGSFGPVCLDKKNDMYGYITSTPKIPWRNYPFVDAMKKALNCSVGFDTDVNASVLGEVTFGCGKGFAHVCNIMVGTGIGLGIWSGGDLLHGNLHPEIGHATTVGLLFYQLGGKDCIIDFVISSDFIKLIHKMGCFSTENTILLQPDYIACAIFLALFVKVRCSKIAVTTK